MKVCFRCKIEKPFVDFSVAKRNKDGFQSYCKECTAEYRQENKEKLNEYSRNARQTSTYRNTWLKRTYGITLEQYVDLLTLQGGGCAICGVTSNGERAGKEMSFCVDHDHSCCPGKKSCGKCVRGLLCNNCNFGIGSLRDSIPLLQSAINYLQEHQ